MSDGRSIDWDRGWVAPDGALPLVHDAWLPEADVLRYGGTDVVTLEEVRDVPALVLLGEPGSGKSECLCRESAFAEAAKALEDEVLLVDLGRAIDGRDLRDRVFDDPTFVAWREGTGRLYLHLDALDEAKVQIRKVVTLLEEGLERCDLDRLFLRVACRTADRPVGLERWLADHFGEARVRTLELAPLRVSETKAMVASWSVDVEDFINDAIAAGVAPLAARPLSLKLLLRVYENEGGFPDTLAALYHEALLLMAGEDDEERRPLRSLTDTAAYAVAARVAAATVLAGRDAVGDGDDAVAYRELAGGSEVDRLVASPAEVHVDEASVREVLGTALFSARSGGVGWAHRTFGEYLAAYWLAGDRLTDDQVADLLLVDDGTGLKVAPPLRNVAGWLLGMRPSFQGRIAATDALVLVYGDPTSVAVEIRRALLPALLDALDDMEVDRRELRNMWRRVGYEGIEDDLRATLIDRTRDDQTREAAADAVAELQLVGLIPALVELALDPANSVVLRTIALHRLGDFTDGVPLDQLRPLALEAQPGDDDDEIKGAALELCWPAAISADELFNVLTPEKHPALVGAYAMFLHTCVQHLTTAEDLLPGLRWGLTLAPALDATRHVVVVADHVVAKAWPMAATEPAIADALADRVEAVAPTFSPILTSPRSLRDGVDDRSLDDPRANASIAAILVERLAAGKLTVRNLENALLRGFAREIDMTIVIERWASAPTPEIRAAWTEVMPMLARGSHADAIYEVKDIHPELYALVAWRYEPILIDSPEAEALRDAHRRDADRQLRRVAVDPPADTGELDGRAAAYLAAFAEGDVDAFWQLLHVLFVDDDNYVRDEATRSDLTDTAGWRRMDDAARGRIADAALAYVLRADPQTDQWLGRNLLFRPARAGLLALKLLFNERRTDFDALPDETWRRWAAVVLEPRRLLANADAEDDFMQAALARVRAVAPDVARDVIKALLPLRLHGSDIDTARDRLGDLWDTTFDDLLFAQLSRDDLERWQVIGIIESLLAVGREDARDWAIARITPEALLGDDAQRETAVRLADAIADYLPRRIWQLVKEIAEGNGAAHRALLSHLIDHSDSGWEAALESAEVAELFGMLRALFPRDPSAPEERTFAVTIEMRASFWQSRIIERLVAEGTREAVAVLATLEAEHDDSGWIRRARYRAQEELRRALWSPPKPETIVRMGGDDARRRIADAPALRRLILTALDQIAEQMHGAFPLAPALWNTRPHRLPKDENEISNIVAEWLRARIEGNKAIINREVQVNARSGRSADRTDILVQALAPDGADALSVVIEVKGAWHAAVMTALREQLAGQYLKPDLTDQGIYLVFWFSAEGWDDYGDAGEHERRRRATRESATGLETLLREQAREVSLTEEVAIDALVIDGSVH